MRISFSAAAACAAIGLVLIFQSQLAPAALLAWMGAAFTALGIWLRVRPVTDATHWQLVKPYFDGAKTYTVTGPNGADLDIEVHADGHFTLNEWPPFPIGVFARRIRS